MSAEHGSLKLDCLREPGTPELLVITLAGRLDGNGAVAFATFLKERVSEADASIILEIKQLSFISSAGLRVLLELAKRLDRMGKKAVLSGAHATVSDALEIAGFHPLFHLVDGLDNARSLLAGGAIKKPGFLGRLFK